MAKTALDAIDRKILKYQIKNARMPFLEIARECGISGAAIHQRIRKLDDSGWGKYNGSGSPRKNLGITVDDLEPMIGQGVDIETNLKGRVTGSTSV